MIFDVFKIIHGMFDFPFSNFVNNIQRYIDSTIVEEHLCQTIKALSTSSTPNCGKVPQFM